MAHFVGESLDCIRGERLVLSRLGFEVSDEQVLVLTGKNGAGKSTLLRLMSGLLKPSDGRLTWDGENILEDITDHNRRITYIGHAEAVKPTLSVIENVDFWRSVRDTPGSPAMDALDAVGIGHLANLPARYLSAGQKRRVALTRALTSGAKLWLLDEPTTALDAESAAMFGAIIDAHRRAGGIAVISTHSDLGLDDVRHLNLDPS